MAQRWQPSLFSISLIMAVLLLSSCAAMFVPATSNPHKKLGYAEMLYDQMGRPLPAERLIREAIDTFSEHQDKQGLADAYREYGFFFRSASIRKWQVYYEKHRFLEPGATVQNRYLKSVSYFDKAAALYTELGQEDALTNVVYNRGASYSWAGDTPNACKSYDEAIVHYQKNIAQHPEAKVNLPEGFTSFPAYIDSLKKGINCP